MITHNTLLYSAMQSKLQGLDMTCCYQCNWITSWHYLLFVYSCTGLVSAYNLFSSPKAYLNVGRMFMSPFQHSTASFWYALGTLQASVGRCPMITLMVRMVGQGVSAYGFSPVAISHRRMPGQGQKTILTQCPSPLS